MSPEDFLPRFLLGLTVAILAVWLVVGGGVARPSSQDVLGAGVERGAWATPAELSWLAKLGAWNRQLIGGARTTGLDAASCSTGLAREVGQAPTHRLEKAFGMFRRACGELAEQDAHQGGDLLLRADQMVPPGEVRELPVIGGDTRLSRIEPRFGHIASSLARKNVEVRCWSIADWRRLMREERTYTGGSLGPDTLGFAGIRGSRINLAPAVCAGLVALAYRGERPSDEAGRLFVAAAVVTLSHEPRHSKGVVDEAEAECNAIQVAQRTAMKLGASRGYAASLVRTYWSHYDAELEAYRSPECRNGGALDLGYADSIWP